MSGGVVAVLVVTLLMFNFVLPLYQINTFPGQYSNRYDKAIAMNGRKLYAGSTFLLKQEYRTAPNTALGNAIFRNYTVQNKVRDAISFGRQFLSDYSDHHDFRIVFVQYLKEHNYSTEAERILNQGIAMYPDQVDNFQHALTEVQKS